MKTGLSKKEKLQMREKYCVAVIASIDREYFRNRKIWQNRLLKCQQQLIEIA